MNNLALAHQAAGKVDLALPLLEQTLKLRKGKLGPEHPDTLISMNNLAMAYDRAGKLDLALPLFEETLKLRKPSSAPNIPTHFKPWRTWVRATRTRVTSRKRFRFSKKPIGPRRNTPSCTGWSERSRPT